MKRILSMIALVAMTGGLATAQQSNITSLAIGSTMPKGDVKMEAVSGGEVNLNMIKTSQGTLVMFSCNTCPYVVKA